MLQVASRKCAKLRRLSTIRTPPPSWDWTPPGRTRAELKAPTAPQMRRYHPDVNPSATAGDDAKLINAGMTTSLTAPQAAPGISAALMETSRVQRADRRRDWRAGGERTNWSEWARRSERVARLDDPEGTRKRRSLRRLVEQSGEGTLNRRTVTGKTALTRTAPTASGNENVRRRLRPRELVPKSPTPIQPPGLLRSAGGVPIAPTGPTPPPTRRWYEPRELAPGTTPPPGAAPRYTHFADARRSTCSRPALARRRCAPPRRGSIRRREVPQRVRTISRRVSQVRRNLILDSQITPFIVWREEPDLEHPSTAG